jgi:hypothetical protein
MKNSAVPVRSIAKRLDQQIALKFDGEVGSVSSVVKVPS